MAGEWIVWVIVDERPREYGCYDSRERALEVAAYVAAKKAA